MPETEPPVPNTYRDEALRLKTSGKQQAFTVQIPKGMDANLSQEEKEKIEKLTSDKYEGLSDLDIMRIQLQEFLEKMEK
jgi:hypothetical protein